MGTSNTDDGRPLIDRVVDIAEEAWVGDPTEVNTSMTPIFEAAGYRRGGTYRSQIKGGKAAVAARVLQRKLEPFAAAMDDPTLADRADYPIGPLREGIEQLIDILFDNRVVVAETMKGITDYTARHGRPVGAAEDPRTYVPIGEIFTPLLEAASSRRLLRDDADPAEMAAMLGNMAILLGFTRAGEDRKVHARQLQQFLLDGVLDRPVDRPDTPPTHRQAVRVDPPTSVRGRAVDQGMTLLNIHLGFQPDPADPIGWRLANTPAVSDAAGIHEALSWLTLHRVADAQTGMTVHDLQTAFGTVQQFREAVVARVLRAERQALHLQMAQRAGAQLPAADGMTDAIAALADRNLRLTARNPTFAVQSLLSAHAVADQQVAGLLAGMYDDLAGAWKPLYRTVVARVGLDFADPMGVDGFAVLATALVEGLAVRAWAQPDLVDRGADTLASHGIAALLVGMLDSRQGPTIDRLRAVIGS